ncbi:hypothetical protein [Rubrivirga litoralis]|uniref:Uncharacterized protein n=1 Tax=Rubrivirga litoralis TaxID=3075598 RepID=A0ABU3BLQ5_9BACT|nr:hypothetical protein [Rubrivirga sp. F394]MDT0630217.1 hypothetical protein [Rubrivirga sp. F394]
MPSPPRPRAYRPPRPARPFRRGGGVVALGLAVLALWAPTLAAQARLPAQVTAAAVYQQVLDDSALGDSSGLRQIAVPLVVLVPVARGVDLSLRAAYATSSRDGGESVGGFADAEVALSVRRPVGGGAVAVGLAATVPAGGGLTRAEAATAFLAAQDVYALAAPYPRRGPSVMPSVSVAVPAGPSVVVGGGVAYRLRTGFEPRADLDASFNPGDELALTAGVDVLLADGSTVAVDGHYVRFGTDTLGELEYTTGDTFGASAEWAGLVGGLPVRVLAAGRRKAGSDAAGAALTRLGQDAAVPTQARLVATLRARFGPALTADVSAGGRYYAESNAFASRALADVRVAPAYRVSDRVAVVGRLGGTVGSFTAFEAGLGLSVGL